MGSDLFNIKPYLTSVKTQIVDRFVCLDAQKSPLTDLLLLASDLSTS